MALADSILNAYRTAEQGVLAKPGQEMAQVGALQGILQRAQQAQMQQQGMAEDQQLKGVLAQTGGNPEKAIAALVQAGTPKSLALAAQLKAFAPKPAEAYTLAPGGQRYGANNELVAEAPMRPDKAQNASNLSRLMAERDALPPADPRRANYDNAIRKESETAKQISPTIVMPRQERSYPIVQTAEGIFERRPEGLVKLTEPGTDKALTPASIAGGGQLNPDALRLTAEQYLAGDRQAVQGYARNAAARIALQNEITKVAKERGYKGADIAAQMADFAGITAGSRTVGTRAAQIELASSEAEKMIDIAADRSKAFERTKFVPVNVAIKAFETNTGAPEVKAFGAAVNSLVNVYARAISPSGVPTVSDKDHAREMLSVIDSPEQFKAVTDVMRQEMKAARAAPGEVRAATRRAVTGNETPAAAPKRVANDADYNALQSGESYIAPDGSTRKKK